MSDFKKVTKSWDTLVESIVKTLRAKHKRTYTLASENNEQRMRIWIERDTQLILIKLSMDIRFKKVLEKEESMFDILSQDATLSETVKQSTAFKEFRDCLDAYRDAERSSTVYSKLGN
jgi:hypothetical protein